MLDVNKVKFWHDHGLWTAAMVRNAVTKGLLTEEQYAEITGEEYK